MRKASSTDFETYKEIMGELMQPISAQGLEPDTLKRLYESKLVYLENLRVKCFYEVNGKGKTFFTIDDYNLILLALQETRRHLRDLILIVISNNLAKRNVV